MGDRQLLGSENLYGRRVATGVYLVFCASKDGSQSCVTKMLVIK
jgi:hypothetical protein